MQKPQETQIPEEMGRWLWDRVWESPEKGPDPARAGVGMGDLARTGGRGHLGTEGWGDRESKRGPSGGCCRSPGGGAGCCPAGGVKVKVGEEP